MVDQLEEEARDQRVAQVRLDRLDRLVLRDQPEHQDQQALPAQVLPERLEAPVLLVQRDWLG
jgi:hypothetical protein